MKKVKKSGEKYIFGVWMVFGPEQDESMNHHALTFIDSGFIKCI